jgi:hypothetical protein
MKFIYRLQCSILITLPRGCPFHKAGMCTLMMARYSTRAMHFFYVPVFFIDFCNFKKNCSYAGKTALSEDAIVQWGSFPAFPATCIRALKASSAMSTITRKPAIMRLQRASGRDPIRGSGMPYNP